MRYLLAAFLVVGLIIVPWIAFTFPDQSAALARYMSDAGKQLAAALVSHDPVTVAELKSGYDGAATPGDPKVRILIVPGHEPHYGGAEFGDAKERRLTVEVADDLAQFLRSDGRFDVTVTRTDSDWNEPFKSYFANDWNSIVAWAQANKSAMEKLERLGLFTVATPAVFHNDAPAPVAYRLYGIDKWADDNGMDIVIHIHFNDYPGHGSAPGKYHGFAIYVPEHQYYNSSTTKALAETVFKRLATYNPVSDLPGEKDGIVEDQDLIAVGSFNTVNAASMLIEYSYIYEPQIQDEAVRPTFLRDLAYQTYLGLIDFFDPAKSAALARTYDTLTLPYYWKTPLTGRNDSPLDVFALQTALIAHGDYPPRGMTLSECPRTGKLGECTKDALAAFKEEYAISTDTAPAGPETLSKLNQLFSSDVRVAPGEL